MATLRERRPGVWEVRVFTGTDARGRPTQLSKTIHGGKRDALRVAAEMEVGPGRASPGGRTVSDVLDAWVAAEPRHVGAVVGTRSAEPGARHQEGPDRPATAGPPVGR